MEDERKTKKTIDQAITTPHLSLESLPGTPMSSNSTSPASSPPLHLLTPENPIVKSPNPLSKKFKKIGSGVSISRIMNMAALGFRVFAAICCLVSFSIMSANKNKGWALDSFYHYKEFSYILAVNVIGFIYSAGQVFDLVYYFATRMHVLKHPYRYFFDFALDQMVAYLLISASSSATTRIDDWQLNWGKDKFPDMATGSVAISFLAFVSLAFSTLISGYALCTSKVLQF